jgi:hypothetical protein
MDYYEKKFFLRPGEKIEIRNIFGIFGWWALKGRGKILDVDFEEEYEIFPENFPDDIDHPPVNPLEIKGRNLIFSADENCAESFVFNFLFIYKL